MSAPLPGQIPLKGPVPGFVSAKQAGAYLGCDSRTIRRLIHSGRLEARVLPWGCLIRVADLHQVAREQATRAERDARCWRPRINVRKSGVSAAA